MKNKQIYYLDLNPHCNKTLIFLHGLGTDHRCFNDQIEFFRESEFRIIAIDFRGFGKSRLMQFSNNLINQLSKDVIAIITQLKLKNITLIGLSLGGVIALNLMQKPVNTEINKLILISTTHNYLTQTKIQQCRLFLRIVLSFILPFKLISKIVAFQTFKTMPLMRQEFYKQIINANKKIYKQLLKELIFLDLSKDLGQINIPVLIFYGSKDHVLKKYNQEIFAKFFKNSLLIKLNTGHAVNIEAKKQLNQQILKFLT